MYKAYKFRLYPNQHQKELIHKTFGCTRFVYNYFLHECKNNGYQKAYDMCNKLKDLVKEHDIIVSEKLKVKEMSRNHNLAKYILDASFNKICNLIKWKTKIEGKYYYQVDSYYPSSKSCSSCNQKTEKTNKLNIKK